MNKKKVVKFWFRFRVLQVNIGVLYGCLLVWYLFNKFFYDNTEHSVLVLVLGCVTAFLMLSIQYVLYITKIQYDRIRYLERKIRKVKKQKLQKSEEQGFSQELNEQQTSKQIKVLKKS